MLKAAVLLTRSGLNGTTGSGTGFAYGVGMTRNEDTGRVSFRDVYIVTCAHVINEPGTTQVQIWSNKAEGGRIHAPHGIEVWVTHPRWREGRKPEHDVAVTRFVTPSFEEGKNVEWRPFTEEETWTKREIQMAQVWEGNPILTWGFPAGYGIEHPKEHHPFLRRGVVSRMQPWTDGLVESFEIDVAAYPGQSGSPVVLEPVVLQIEGHPNITSPKLVGMLCRAPLTAPGKVRHQKVGEGKAEEIEEALGERIGIGEVVPMKAVRETIEAFNPEMIRRRNARE